MTQQEISCGLDYTATPDLQACLTEALHSNYSFIVAPLVHPRFRRHYVSGAGCVGGFTRSDMVLSPQDWTTRIVAKLSPYLNVDSPLPLVRSRHEDCLTEELYYSRALGVPAIMLSLHGRDSHNLARILHTFFETNFHPILLWMHVPMLCHRTLRNTPENSENEEAWNETWHWWSKFHELMDFDKRVGVVLELSADLPSEEVIKRWLGEPVKAVVIPTSIFHNNKKGLSSLREASRSRSRSRSRTPHNFHPSQRPSAARRALLMGLALEGPAPDPRDESPPRISLSNALCIQKTPGGSMAITGEQKIIKKTPGGHVRLKQPIPFPVLSKAHQNVVVSMVERDAQVIVSGARRSNIEFYLQYLYQLWQRRRNPAEDPLLCYARGWEDYLQTPLQPLADNLDTHTYNVFEKDPVKYDQYQKAIVKALTDIQKKESPQCDDKNKLQKENVNTDGQSESDKEAQGDVDNRRTITVMVLGAGRGPLVRATFNAADITKSKVKVVVVEKNPCAVVVLAAQVREVWRDRDVTLIPGDMRHIDLSLKADIIVSELLGSWGDNELSPECLDGAAGLLKPGGISIPCEYRSFVAPISSPRLWGAAKATTSTGPSNYKDKNLETLWVVYMQNKHNVADTKLAFTFNHPAKGAKDLEGQEMTDYRGLPLTDNRRSETISWEVTQDNVMHGFGGYFDCTLYRDEMISIVPSTHSPGMISWFPVFIPIKTPLRVQKGETIVATFWRCRDSRRVWYEWVVRVGERSTSIHNPSGRSSEMLL